MGTSVSVHSASDCWSVPLQIGAELWDSIRSAITAARCDAVGGTYRPKRLIDPEFTAAFVESADASGIRENTFGFSIRNPCNLQTGRPLSQIASITCSMRVHHGAVPGTLHWPDDPSATTGNSRPNRCNLLIDSCRCQTGTPCRARSAGHSASRASFSSSLPSIESGINAQTNPGWRHQSRTHWI